MGNTTCPEYTEKQDDVAFRIYMGENNPTDYDNEEEEGGNDDK